MNEILPLVSVIVPCYNHERYVKDTIHSILNQTYQNIELIVIDDGSTDSSNEILEDLSQQYGFYYEHQANRGLPATLNKAIKISVGKYISMIASDDIMALDKIEVLVNEIEKLDETYAVVCGDAQFIDDNGNNLFMIKNNHQYNRLIEYYLSDREDFIKTTQFGKYSSLLKGNYIPALSALIRRDTLINVGLYEEDMCLEDWNMWLKLSRNYKFKFVDKVVAFYRYHDSNSTKVMSKKLTLSAIKTLEREKKYCFDNSLSVIWRNVYYSNIKVYINSHNYIKFIKRIFLHNIFHFNVYIFKKLILNLSIKTRRWCINKFM